MKFLKKLIIPIFLLIGFSANAQQSDSIVFNDFTPTELRNLLLDEVQVTGVKTRREEPVSLTIISPDSLKSGYVGSDPFFVLNRQSPSIYSLSDNGLPYSYSYIRMRGLDQTRINFTLNGIPLNEMEDQGIYFSNMPDFLGNIGKVEVQRGIGTSKYGTTSIAGSVNMETKSLLKQKVEAESSYGSFNTFKNSLGYTSGLINETIAFSSRFSHLRTDGFKDNSGSNGYTFFGQLGFFDDYDVMKVYGFTGRSQNQMAWLAPTKSQIDNNYRVNGNTTEEHDDFGQNFIAANWVNFRHPEVKINTSIYYNNINGYYLALLDTATMGRFGINSFQGGGMTNVVWNNNKGVNLNGGLNYNNYRRKHTLADNTAVNDLWYENWGYKQDVIAYLKTTYTFKKNWNVFGDVQYRYVNFSYDRKKSWDWHFVNPKIGIKYLEKDWNVYLSGAMTSREVTRTDLLRGYDDVLHLGGNTFEAFGDTFQPNILPEIVYDVELGGAWKNRNFDLALNGYMMYFNNERIAYGEINYIGLSLKNPVDRSIRTGIEFDGSWKYRFNKSEFVISTNFNWSYNRIFKWTDNNGDVYRNTEPYASPMMLMNNYIGYHHKFFSLGFQGSYVDRSFLDNTGNTDFISPAFYQLNGHFGIHWKYFDLRLNVNNILDTEYLLPAGISNGEPTYYVGALRNYFVTLSVKL